MANNCYELNSGIALSICAQKQGADGAKKAAEASDRLFRVASMLSSDKTLQFQLRFDKEREEIDTYVYSNEKGITSEDYDWIFQTCRGAASKNLYEEAVRLKNRNVYTIVPLHMDTSHAAQEYEEFEDPYSFPSARFSELLEMLYTLSAELRITLNEGRSKLCIAISEEMSFRMRALLSTVFPNTKAQLINAVDNSLEEKTAEAQLPLWSVLSEVLVFLMADKDKHDSNGVEETTSDSDNAPIADLDLSVRSYNCLMRAEVDTIGKLRAMSDEELRQVRNLGRKWFEEVKQRLEEYEERRREANVPELTGSSYLVMLDEMIGLDGVKEQVRKIASFSRMKKDMDAKGSHRVPIALNMAFVGNPGTAKTTVARILAGIFNEMGVLSSNDLIEVGRSDLVGKYIGQTAAKVKEVFRQARGKLLFIDEAYSLVDHWEDSYGDEAIDTIVQEIENNRNDTIVIFAGYPKEMSVFLSRNPGLRSRVPFLIEFKDYSADELVQIAGAEAEKRGFMISENAREQLHHICKMAAGTPEAGNGRFCRNLIENAILNYASRCYSTDGKCDVKDFRLRREDLTIPKAAIKENNSIQIGFRG